MSDHANSQRPQNQPDPHIGLLFGIADQLIPLFSKDAGDTIVARAMAVSAIEAYQPESRADFVNIARTIAFSIVALSLLGQAARENLELSGKMRVLGRAITLNRSADQSERTMMLRRRYQNANAHAKSPAPAAEAPEPEMDDAAIQVAVAQSIAHAISQTQTVKPASAPVQTAKPAQALISPAIVPAQLAAAVRYAIPSPTQPDAAPNRQSLLRHTAMQRVVNPGAAHPG